MSRISFEYLDKHTDTGYIDTMTILLATKLWITDKFERQQVIQKIKNLCVLEEKEFTVKRKGEVIVFNDTYYNTKFTNPYNKKDTLYGFSYRCLTGYLSIRLRHKAVHTKKPATIIKDIKTIMSNYFNIDDKYVHKIDDYIYLGRIDYKRDYKYRDLEEYCLIKQIIDIAPDNIVRGFYSKKDKADTEIEYIKVYKTTSNKTAQFSIYNKDKEQQYSLDIGEIDEFDYQKYYHTVRFEVRLLNGKLNALKQKGISKRISSYRDKEVAKSFFEKYAIQAFFTEPIFRIDVAKEKINQSMEKDNMKSKLCEVLDSINTKGYTMTRDDYVTIVTNNMGKQQNNYSKFNRYINKIRQLGVNPLTLKTTWRDEDGNIADTTYTQIPNFILEENCLEEEGMFVDD